MARSVPRHFGHRPSVLTCHGVPSPGGAQGSGGSSGWGSPAAPPTSPMAPWLRLDVAGPRHRAYGGLCSEGATATWPARIIPVGIIPFGSLVCRGSSTDPWPPREVCCRRLLSGGRGSFGTGKRAFDAAAAALVDDADGGAGMGPTRVRLVAYLLGEGCSLQAPLRIRRLASPGPRLRRSSQTMVDATSWS